MRMTLVARVLAVLMLATVLVAPVAAAASVEERRGEVRKMADSTLGRLYKEKPSAQGAIESAAGYAVFSNHGFKLFLFGGGGGKGMAVNNGSGEEVFMKMAEVDIGFGLGIKKFSVIFVFETDKAFNSFVNDGWKFGGQTTAAATDGVSGDSFQGAVVVGPGIWMYQMTDKGLALELTAKGTRYYKDSDLN
ncbi:MAG: YSC84-related protein [Sporomusaceae bacterium]|nr:YSC84-related protein [Sporomusaceae bacterium]